MSLSESLIRPLFEDSDIQVHDPSLFRDVLLKGSSGLGDSYVERKWDGGHIDKLIFNILSRGAYQKVMHIYNASRIVKDRLVNLQDKIGSRKVIERHYDLPVQFFAA